MAPEKTSTPIQSPTATAEAASSGTPEASLAPGESEAPKVTDKPIANPEATDVLGKVTTVVYDGTNSDEIRSMEGKFRVVIQDGVTEIADMVFE